MDYIYNLEDRILDELKDIASKDAQQEMTMDTLTELKYLSSSLDHLSSYMDRKNGAGFSQSSGPMTRRGMSRNSGRYNIRGDYSRGRMMDDWGREPYDMY